MVEVNKGQDDQAGGQDGFGDAGPRDAKAQADEGKQDANEGFDHRIARRDRSFTRTASTPKQKPGDDRDIVDRPYPGAAGRAT